MKMADNIERIPQHRHCMNCNKAFIGDGRYCTPECENGKVTELKSKRNKLLIQWGIAVVIMVVAIIWLL